MSPRRLILPVLAATLGALAFTATPALAALETPEKEEVTSVTATTATISGVLAPKATEAGEGGLYFFTYGISPPSACGGEGLVSEGPGGMAVEEELGVAAGLPQERKEVHLTGLHPHSRYTFCMYERHEEQSKREQTEGAAVPFETLPAPPTVVSESASVESTEAKLAAQVEPNNEPTECHFQYGETSVSEQEAVCEQGNALIGEERGVGLTVKALKPDTTYHYRVLVKNATGEAIGTESEFTTVPAPTTEVPSPIGSSTATFKGKLTPLNATVATKYFFYYNLGEESACTNELATNAELAAAEAVSTAASGLEPSEKYTVCLVSRNASGSEEDPASPPVHFETKPAPPEVVGESATGVTASDASLRAKIDPNNQSTTYTFEYATNAALTENLVPVAGAAPLTGYDSAGEPASVALSGLAPHKTYYYRVVAENAKGEKAQPGEVERFVTGPLEAPEKLEAKPIGATTATLNGALNPGGAVGTGSYEFVYRQSATECQGPEEKVTRSEPAMGEQGEAAKAEVSELLPHTTYTFCLVAHHEGEAKTSAPDTFTTLAAAPTIEEQSVTDISATSFTLNATVDPGGTATGYQFEYARVGEGFKPVTESGGSGSAGEGVIGEPVEVHLQQGIEPNTAYEFRVVVSNSVLSGVSGVPVSFTTQSSSTAFTLSDNRQYEMVSQPDKHGALLAPNGEYGRIVQAAAAGDAIAYVATTATEAEPLGNGSSEEQVLSTRGPGGWSSRDIEITHGRGAAAAVLGEGGVIPDNLYSPDLSHAVVQPFGTFLPCRSAEGAPQPCLSPDASEQTPFLASLPVDALGDSEPPTFIPLVTGCPSQAKEEAGELCEPGVREHADVPLGTVFGISSSNAYRLTPNACPKTLICGPLFVGATPDLSHIVIQSRVSLTSQRVRIVEDSPDGQLYEYSGGQLALLSVLPDGEPPASSEQTIGLGQAPEPIGRRFSGFWRAISEDGSRAVFYTFSGQHQSGSHLYLRVNALQPPSKVASSGPDAAKVNGEQCEEPSKACTIELDEGLANMGLFWTARDVDGETTEVFFTDEGVLYAYNVQTKTREALAGGVQSVIRGSNEDESGAYLYFVSSDKLAEHALSGKANLYVRHDGEIRLVAAVGVDTARVSPDGQWLAFLTPQSPTGYDNRDVASGSPDTQLYLYSASTGSLSCASCNPTGARPSGGAGVPHEEDYYGPEPYEPRYLSNEGRVFFETDDPLVALDVNGAQDVYEYEPENVPSGGSYACSSATQSGSEVFKPAHPFEVEVEGNEEQGEEAAGCVALISSGTSAEDSAFLDASETGGDVFFLTAAKLAPQDYDDSGDVYDAHECTTQSPCTPTSAAQPPPCGTEASCKASPTPQPGVYGSPASATFSGPGNLTPEVAPPPKKVTRKTVKCKRGLVKDRKGGCVREKSKHKKAEKSAKKSSTDRRANR